jgi:AraC-like DNA-binding protein
MALTRWYTGRNDPAGLSALRGRDPAGYVRQDNPVVRSFMVLTQDGAAPERHTLMRLLNTAPDDEVTALLAALAVQSSVYCLSDLGAPWGFEVEGAATAKFHVVLDGGCWLRLAGQEPVWLGPGDLAILPGGQRHSVSDRPDSPVTGLDQLIADHPLDTDARLVCGGGGPRTRLLCGGFTLAGGAPDTVLTLLPPVVTMTPRAALLAAWIGPVFALARQEADAPAPGAQAIFARLADVFLTQALRAYLTGAAQAGLLRPAPLADPLIARAIALLREDPARQWTLPALARETGLSRTALATRFRAAAGEPPIQLLARVRLSQAAAYLTTTDLTLAAIAARTGYANCASLSKAFKRHYGVSPGSYRAAGRRPVAVS